MPQMKFNKVMKEDAFEIGAPDQTPDRMGASAIEKGQQVALKNYQGTIGTSSRNAIINWVRKNFSTLSVTVDNFADVIITGGDLVKPGAQPLKGFGVFFKVADQEGVSAEQGQKTFFYCTRACKAGSKTYAAGQVYEV